MKRTSLAILLVIAAVATLFMLNYATNTTAITSDTHRDGSDPFVALSEFDTQYSQSACQLCKSLPCPSATCHNTNPHCKCQTCNGQYNCWHN